MSAPDFLDTNVFVCAYDSTDAAKQHVAQDLVRRAVVGQTLTSVQVLGEFAATLLHKLTPPLPASDVITILDALSPIHCP
jgi:predicted nucleic acid-binding protein